MIRAAKEEDLARIADIWLDANLKAHNFISSQYWKDQFEPVKALLVQAELYVYEDENGVEGFIGLNEDYIAGIFVWDGAQSRGIGKQLMDFVKGIKKQLRLSVYQRNERAVRFYLRERFLIQRKCRDEHTGEAEYEMVWRP